MSGISPSTAARAARAALFAAIQAATADDQELDRYEGGFMWPVNQNNWVAITSQSTDVDPKNITVRRQVDETITFHLSIGAWVPGRGSDEVATSSLDRAYGILSKIQDYIRTGDNITLGGTVQWCIPGDEASDGAADEDGSGYVTEIDATFVCMHRVR